MSRSNVGTCTFSYGKCNGYCTLLFFGSHCQTQNKRTQGFLLTALVVKDSVPNLYKDGFRYLLKLFLVFKSILLSTLRGIFEGIEFVV